MLIVCVYLTRRYGYRAMISIQTENPIYLHKYIEILVY